MPVDSGAGDALSAARRILVVGPSGSGKTHLTLRLASLLDLPAVHLDARFWQPGWIATPRDEWRREVERLIGAERWIMDGTYEATLEVRLAAAEAVIVLERSRLACLWGVLRRTLANRRGTRPDAPPGQPIDAAFLGYIWHYPVRTRPLVERLLAAAAGNTTVVVLDGPGDVARLLAALASRPAAAGPARVPSGAAG